MFDIGGQTIAAVVGLGRDPVIFLHGNSSTKSVWREQIAYVRSCGRGVLAPDFPGHGESDDATDPERTYSLPGYAGIVRGLLDKLGWFRIDIVGWSLGGHVGLELFATDSRVRSLLVLGTPPARPCAESLQQAFRHSDIMDLAGKRDFSEADARAYGGAMMGAAEYLTPHLLRNVRRTDGRAREHLFASILCGIGADERTCVETLDKPLAVVHGEDEPFVRLEYLQSLRYRSLWRQRVHIIPAAGHAPHRQCPATFNRLMSEFLRAVARMSWAY